MVINSLRMVINKMNNAMFPYLSLVVPPFIRTMEQKCDSAHFQQIACFLIDLVQLVKEHKYKKEIYAILIYMYAISVIVGYVLTLIIH